MIYKRATPDPGFVEVTFELPTSLWADHITLAGEFNDWNEHNLPFRQEKDGCWRLQLILPAGQRYQFSYLIDGRWGGDCSNCHRMGAIDVTSNPYGGYNCVFDTTLDEVENGEIEL